MKANIIFDLTEITVKSLLTHHQHPTHKNSKDAKACSSSQRAAQHVFMLVSLGLDKKSPDLIHYPG